MEYAGGTAIGSIIIYVVGITREPVLNPGTENASITA